MNRGLNSPFSLISQNKDDKVVREESSRRPLEREDFERMARRRFQDPKPARRGQWWTLRIWKDTFKNGKLGRSRERIRLAPISTNAREVQRLASEYLRPLNQSLESIGSATNFQHYVETVYITTDLPLMANSTQQRYRGVIRNYLIPAFGAKCLRDLTHYVLQAYFTGLVSSPLSYESKDKIRDVRSSILQSAIAC